MTHSPDSLATLEARAVPHPWRAGQYRDSLSAGHLFFTEEAQDRLLAFAVVMPVLDEAELLNIVVDPDCQGRGIGKRLMARILLALRETGCTRLMLEVRESNAPARSLYLGCGFRENGRRKGYYPAEDGREDAILMEIAP